MRKKRKQPAQGAGQQPEQSAEEAAVQAAPTIPAVPAEAKKKPKGKRRKLIRRIIVLVLVLALVGGGAWLIIRKMKKDYTVTYDPYTATVGTISNSLSYSGSMQLVSSAAYTAESSAKVREVYVKVGDAVKEGDKLVRLSSGTTVTADFDATVNTVSVEKGDEVKMGDSLVQIADFDHMRVSFRIGESDISEVSVGTPVRVTVASVGASFDSSISTIDYASYSGNNVAYYTSTVDVDTTGVENIYPGMQATITITQEEASNVVILKMDAISTTRENSAFVYKQAEDGTMTEQEITVGVSNGNYVEIKSGVEDGETVYAIAEVEEESGGLLSGLFGGQQINAPSGGMPGGGSGSFPGGGDFPSGFSGGSGGSGGFSRPSGSGGSGGSGGGFNRGN